jgi:tetratricopeptide (TPR) repeat protein
MPGKQSSRLLFDFATIRIWSMLFFLSTIILNQSFAQRVKIDSLKTLLSELNDSSRVDCLNSLSFAYSYLSTDTALSYCKRAFREASDLGYERGLVRALNNEARIAGHGLHDFALQEKLSREIIYRYKDIKDKEATIEAYLNLALSLFIQGAFEDSEETCSSIATLSRAAGNQKYLGESIVIMGCINLETGNYGKSFEYFNEGLRIFRNIKDSYNTAILLVKLGDLYRLAGDHQTAVSFYFQSLEHATGPSLSWNPLVDLGDISYSIEQYDSNSYPDDQYFQVIKSLTVKRGSSDLSRIRKAEMLIASGDFHNALPLLRTELQVSIKNNTKSQIMRLLLDLTKVYAGKHDFTQAFSCARELMRIAKAHKARQYIRDADWQLYLLHEQLRHTDSAYYYFRQYTIMKDEVALDQFSKRLAIYKAATESEKQQAQIELLNREKLIDQQQLQISAQQLENESNYRKVIFAGVIVMGLFGFIVFRNVTLKQKNEASRREIIEQELNVQRLESERTKSELQQKASELEMQALRAQMNPHFVFNSLSSINRFILQNNRNQASEYLTKFSKLIRLILQNSQASLIPLESELESLELYLELEAVRFEHHFTYKIIVNDQLYLTGLKVPPLVIQPYAENAIWHGLMHKEDKGTLTIELFEETEMLCCKITDDGIGRKMAQQQKSKSANTHKSMGMRITAERISLLQRQTNLMTSITINDLVFPDGNAGGTEVFLKLPLQYD